MNIFSPQLLQAVTNGIWNQQPNVPITGFSNDTRTLKKGNVFVALTHGSRNGHDFLDAARAAGASAAMIDQPFNLESPLPQLKVEDSLKGLQLVATNHRNEFKGAVIGITGSCGKTSTKDLVSYLLQSLNPYSTHANLNNFLGVPLNILQINPTKHQVGIIEAGANLIGEMETLASMVKPNVAIVTGIAPVHLEGFQTIENLAFEKAALIRNCHNKGVGLFGEDCLKYKAFQSVKSNAWIVQAVGSQTIKGCIGTINYESKHIDSKNQRIHVSSELWGSECYELEAFSNGMNHNIALALISARMLGVSIEDLQIQLKKWKPSKHRGEILKVDKQVWYVDCYNSNPVALIDAVHFFNKKFEEHNRKLYIIGGMEELGPNSYEYHVKAGASIMVQPEDLIIFVGIKAQAIGYGFIQNNSGCTHQVIYVDQASDVVHLIHTFEGAIFLKGSNGHQLWTLLPSISIKNNDSFI